MLARLADLGSRELAIVAEHEGEVGGFGWLESHDDRPGYRFACETSIYLSPRAWGTGLGDLPQRALLEAGAALQYRHVVAKILSVNSRSLRFHARPGFELVGVQRSVGRVGDDWHHVSILQYLLD